jgi:hypothetical protein
MAGTHTDVGFSHMVVWQPRTRRWTLHTDNVAGSSDVSSKNEDTRESDNSDHTKDSSNSSRDQASLGAATPRTARGLLCVQCGYRDSTVCSVNPQKNY